jgi:hypothetical protein
MGLGEIIKNVIINYIKPESSEIFGVGSVDVPILYLNVTNTNAKKSFSGFYTNICRSVQ